MIKGNKDLSVGYLVIVLYKQEGDRKFRRILMGDGLTRGEADEIVEGISC